MGKSVGAWAFAGALLLTACAAPEVPPDPAEEAILADFHRATYGQTTASGGHLAKWTGPIRVVFLGMPEEADRADALVRYRRQALDHLADLGGLSGLDISEEKLASANLLVVFADDPFAAARQYKPLYGRRITDPRGFDDLLARMEQRDTCFSLVWGGWPGGRPIDFGAVFIRTGLGDRTVEGCLVQQTTQVLGLRYHLDPGADSVLGDTGEHVALTPQDRLILRLLYDPRLKPGMGWAEAEPLARTALRDLREGGGG